MIYSPINEVVDREVVLSDGKATNERINKYVEGLYGDGQSLDYYGKVRNASSRVAENSFTGKKAEVIAWEYFASLGFPSIDLDFEIRTGRSKGWHPDLPYNQTDPQFPNVHVKSCLAWVRKWVGDYTWTFQWSNAIGGGGKDHIFDSPGDDLVSLVFMEQPNSSNGTIKAIVPWKIINPLLREPKLESLRGLKKCLYYQDLLKSDEE